MKKMKVTDPEMVEKEKLLEWEDELNQKYLEALSKYEVHESLLECDMQEMEFELRGKWVARRCVNDEQHKGWETPWQSKPWEWYREVPNTGEERS